jgi:probable phosphoglycerate mutase
MLGDMKEERYLYLFRHGQTEWNRVGRFQGQRDIPLNDTGREQARALIEPLRRVGIQSIISSTLLRARQTAGIVAGGLDVPVFHDQRLVETNFGEAEGMTRDEIIEKYGQEMADRWRSSNPNDQAVAFPGGESGAEIMNRTTEALHDFLLKHPFRVFGVSAHGGVIRRLFQKILPPDQPPVPIPNGVLYPLVYSDVERKFRFEGIQPWTPESKT